MTYDIKITGRLIIDGTGAPGYIGAIVIEPFFNTIKRWLVSENFHSGQFRTIHMFVKVDNGAFFQNRGFWLRLHLLPPPLWCYQSN